MANIDIYQRPGSLTTAEWQPDVAASFSTTHADLLDMFERWEVLADADSAPRIDVAVRTTQHVTLRPTL